MSDPTTPEYRTGFDEAPSTFNQEDAAPADYPPLPTNADLGFLADDIREEPVTWSLICDLVRKAIAADRTQRSGVSADPLPLTDTYVQPVPDKCDRITWRGQYYHLPVSSQSQPLVEPQAVTIFNALDEAAQTILGEETRNNVREWLRRAWHHNVCPAIAASPQHQVKKGEPS